MKIIHFLALTAVFAPIATMACEGRQDGESASAAYSDLHNIDVEKTPTVEEFCASLRSRRPEVAECYASCEYTYKEEFANVKKDKEQRAAEDKSMKERQLAEQQEEERKSVAKDEEQGAAIKESGVSVEKAAEIAGDMYRAYRHGEVGDMLSKENTCWKALAKNKKTNEVAAISCSIFALSGAFIEAAYAYQQGRVPTLPYNGDIFRKRLLGNMEKAGINEDRARHLLNLTDSHRESILLGLINAGMR